MDLESIQDTVALGDPAQCSVARLADYVCRRFPALKWDSCCDQLGAETLADFVELQESDVRASSLAPVQQRRILMLLEDFRAQSRPAAQPQAAPLPRPQAAPGFDPQIGSRQPPIGSRPPRAAPQAAPQPQAAAGGGRWTGTPLERPRAPRVQLVPRQACWNDSEPAAEGEGWQPAGYSTYADLDEGADCPGPPRKAMRASLVPRGRCDSFTCGPQPMHVSFVLDTSKSMILSDVEGARTRMDAVFQAVSGFLQSEAGNASEAVYSLVLFSSIDETTVSFAGLPAGAADAKLQSVRCSVRPWGPTLYGAGLDALSVAVHSLEQRELEQNEPSLDQQLEHIVLFLSDGKPGDSPFAIKAKVQKLRAETGGRLHLHTVGFGMEAANGSLKDIAEVGGGEFWDNVGVPSDIAHKRVEDGSSSQSAKSEPVLNDAMGPPAMPPSKLQASMLSHTMSTVLCSTMQSVRASSAVRPSAASRPLEHKVLSLQKKLLAPPAPWDGGPEDEVEESWGAVRMMENGGRLAVSGQDKLLFADKIEDVLCTIKSVPLRAVRVSKRPFATGGMRTAHRMWDKQTLLVAKQTFLSMAGEAGSIDETLATNRKFLQMHSLAAECAKAFNKELGKGSVHKISFVDAYVYLLLGGDRSIQRCYNAEQYLEGQYVKYNNNNGDISPSDDYQNRLAQAFSHFSYEQSGGDSIIVDIQGVGLRWTDPQIHSRIGEFGDGDHGKKGIDMFFKSHRCNEFCRELKLSTASLACASVCVSELPLSVPSWRA